MYIKKITYTDYNGESQTEPFYFNLNKGELLKVQLSKNGGYETYLNRLIETKDQAEMMDVFDQFIKMSYGVKSDDGKRFIKNAEVLNDFVQSEAYSELLTELLTDEKAALDFVNGIIPAELINEVTKQVKKEDK